MIDPVGTAHESRVLGLEDEKRRFLCRRRAHGALRTCTSSRALTGQFGTVCGWTGAGFMCRTLEMLHALTGASADSIMDVWVAILTVEMHADRAVDDRTTITSTQSGDHQRSVHAHARRGIGQWSV